MPDLGSVLCALWRVVAVCASIYWQWASSIGITPYAALNGAVISVALLDLIVLLVIAIRGLGKEHSVIFQPHILYPFLAVLLMGLAFYALLPVFDRLMQWAEGK